jgi:hypothetical protein
LGIRIPCELPIRMMRARTWALWGLGGPMVKRGAGRRRPGARHGRIYELRQTIAVPRE